MDFLFVCLNCEIGQGLAAQISYIMSFFDWELAHTQNTALICRLLLEKLLNLGPPKMYFPAFKCVNTAESPATWPPIVKNLDNDLCLE